MDPTPTTAGARAAADVVSLLRARNPLLWIITREEARVERLLFDAATAARYEPVFWDCVSGLTSLTGSTVAPGRSVSDADAVLNLIATNDARRLYVLRDLPAHFRLPEIVRGVRSIARNMVLKPASEARSVVILTPIAEVPPELQGHAVVIEWPMPDREEIAQILDSTLANLPEDVRAGAALNGAREAAIDAAIGLTALEAESCYARSLVVSRKIDARMVSNEKRRVIARERVLEWFDPLPGGLDAVGGLDALKGWLVQRRAAFSPEARAYGLPAPKGALLVGVPGCGKSLTAKAIATAWAMPLLKLDMGALRSKFVGDSEANIRKALKVAESVAPCVLWVDEVEKALAGAAGGGASDGGVSSDALGTILSWMQDRAGSVFVVMTANDVSALPPELLRKGRLDEIWFVDLPNRDERGQILSATLASFARSSVVDRRAALLDMTDGFTGAELAALVPDALYAAFADGGREIDGADLIVAARATVPLSKTASERIGSLRQWASTRARPASASLSSSSVAPAGTRALDLE